MARFAIQTVLVALAIAVATASVFVRQEPACRTAGTRCAGADGQPFVEYDMCCEGLSCSGAGTEYGLFCVDVENPGDYTVTNIPVQASDDDATDDEEADADTDDADADADTMDEDAGTEDDSTAADADEAADADDDEAAGDDDAGDDDETTTDDAASDDAEDVAADGEAAEGDAEAGSDDTESTDDVDDDDAEGDAEEDSDDSEGDDGDDDDSESPVVGGGSIPDSSDDDVDADAEESSEDDSLTGVTSDEDEDEDEDDDDADATDEDDDDTSSSLPDASDEDDATTRADSDPTNEDEDDDVCFPAVATVELEDGSVVPMDSVSVGDVVKVGVDQYSRVFMFTHKMADVAHEFVTLETESGASLSLTQGHYLYVNGALAAAKTVNVGDVLTLGNGKSSAVVAVGSTSGTGLFNPQTVNGNVVVDGVLASTYTTTVEPSFAHAILAPFRMLNNFGFQFTALESGGGILAGAVPRGQAAF